MILEHHLDPRFTFDNFVVGKPNELAFAAAQSVLQNLKHVTFNPLYFYMVGVGLRKNSFNACNGLEN